MAIVGDMKGSRQLFGMGRKYANNIEHFSDRLHAKNQDLVGSICTRYAIASGDSYQGCFDKIPSSPSFMHLFPNFDFEDLDCEYNAVGIGFMYHHNDDSNLCNGTHYVNASKALDYAKVAFKHFGYTTTRFNVGCHELTTMLDHIGILMSDLQKSWPSTYEILDSDLRNFISAILEWLNSQPADTEVEYFCNQDINILQAHVRGINYTLKKVRKHINKGLQRWSYGKELKLSSSLDIALAWSDVLINNIGITLRVEKRFHKEV